MPWLDRSWFVPALGAVEAILGVALLVGRLLTAVCAVLAAHLAGTFLVLIMQPQLAFQDGNPLLLTTIGEFVVKNVVLISAALVLASKLRDSRQPHAPVTAGRPARAKRVGRRGRMPPCRPIPFPSSPAISMPPRGSGPSTQPRSRETSRRARTTWCSGWGTTYRSSTSC